MDIFKPIQLFADLATYRWFGIGKGTYLGSAVNFFVYDTIKIGMLLIVINYIMAITRYFFPMEKVRDFLTKKRWFGLDYLFATKPLDIVLEIVPVLDIVPDVNLGINGAIGIRYFF